MKHITLIILSLSLHLISYGQKFEWAKSINGNSVVEGRHVVADYNGDIYVTGNFNDTIDFDPGPGIYNLSSKGHIDIFLMKLDSSGNLIWVKTFGGGGPDHISTITIDSIGNTYLAGSFSDTVDFDPGPSVYNLIANNFSYCFILKLNSNGDFIWARSFSGFSNGFCNALKLDALGKLYAVGSFGGTVDFDPGPGVFNLSSNNGSSDIYVLKLDSSGNFINAISVGSSSHDIGSDIDIDSLGNVYLTGNYYFTVDFDPGPGTFFLTAIQYEDIYVLKLDSGLNFVWAKGIGGPANEFGRKLVLDNEGHLYVIGIFRQTIDVDPGPGVYSLTSMGGYDSFVLKLDTAGNFVWGKSFSGLNHINSYGIAIDEFNNLNIVGVFWGTADFDPGPGTNNLISYGNFYDIFIAKLDSSGNYIWSTVFVSSYPHDGATSIFTQGEKIYVTGQYGDQIDFNPGVDSLLLVSSGIHSAFILKLSDCPPPLLSITSTNPLCNGDSITATVMVSGGLPPYNYLWNNGQTLQSVTGITDELHTVIVTDNNYCSAMSSIVIPEPAAIVSNITSSPTNLTSPNCNGGVAINPSGGTPPYNITWSSGTTTNLCEGWYTATITDANGCLTSDSVYVDFQCPVINLSMLSAGPLLCAGDIETITVNAIGGSAPYSYFWSSGDTTPSASLPPGTYTVTVTDANSCTSTITVNFSQAPSAVISNISSTPTNFSSPNCNGSVSINPSGGTPLYYITWSSGSTSNLCEGWYSVTITDANGCIETDSVYVDFITGIEELNSYGISIYPNPAKDILVISSNKKEIGEIKIYNVLGKLVFDKNTVDLTTEINIKELNTGIYFVEVAGVRMKFVKE